MLASPQMAPWKNLLANAGNTEKTLFDSWVRMMLWSRKWQPPPVFCLENFKDRGTWWATDHEATKSQTCLNNCTYTLLNAKPRSLLK